MPDTAQNAPISVTLLSIEERGFLFRMLPADAVASGPLAIVFKIETHYEREPELLYLTLEIGVQLKEDFNRDELAAGATGQPLTPAIAPPLIELSTRFVLHTANATAQFATDPAGGPAWERFPPDLQDALLSTAYATSRGILFAHLSGTSLRQFVLPLISPDMIRELVTNTITK